MRTAMLESVLRKRGIPVTGIEKENGSGVGRIYVGPNLHIQVSPDQLRLQRQVGPQTNSWPPCGTVEELLRYLGREGVSGNG